MANGFISLSLKRFLILGLQVTSSFSKLQTKEPLKLLSSSGMMRGGKFISVNNFSAQEHASSKGRHILNFRVVAVRDKQL